MSTFPQQAPRRYGPAYSSASLHNPSRPRVFIQFSGLTGAKLQREFELTPLTFKHTSSIEALDVVEFTVFDPTYELINEPLLVENLTTEVTIRYGYARELSEPLKMVFFRQSPRFTEAGVVTTITCYDKGIFLKLPVKPTTMEQDKPLTIMGIIESVLADTNLRYNAGINHVETDGHEYVTKLYRVSKAFATPLEFLYWLRTVATPKDAKLLDYPEVYVEGNTLHFHPPRDGMDPQAEYEWFSVIPNSRLLAFEPSVNLYPEQADLGDVDPDSGQVSSVSANLSEGGTEKTSTGVVELSPVTGRVVGRGTLAGEQVTTTVAPPPPGTWTVGTESTLAELASQFPDVNAETLASLNEMETDEVLRPQQVIKVPVPQDKINVVKTLAMARQAPALFLAQQSGAVSATARVLGDPRIRAGRGIVVSNLPTKWQGFWYVKEVEHILGDGGYTMDLELTREGFMGRQEGLVEAQGNTSVLEEMKVDEDAGTKKEQEFITLDPRTNAVVQRSSGR